jgi:PAS domain S-box-containing protein
MRSTTDSSNNAEKSSSTQPTAVFTIGSLDTIEDVDDAACTLLGYGRAELIRMHGSELVPESAHSATAVSLDRMRRGEISFAAGVLRRRDGTLVEVDVCALRRPQGGLILHVWRRPAS